jgi:ankyrin repeat protein
MRAIKSIFNALKKALHNEKKPRPKGILSTDIDRIMAAAEQGKVMELACLFDKYNDDASIFPLTTGVDSGRTMLHRAAAKGDIPLMALLLERGAGIQERDNRGSSPLHAAASCGQTKAVEFLLGRGAVRDAKNGSGWTPLAAAVEKGWRETVEFMIGQGADVNARDGVGLPVLFMALPRPALVTLLINSGAEVDAVDSGGWTPLAWACARKDLPDQRVTLETLFSHGARLDIVSGAGKTLTEIAAEHGSAAIVSMIEKEAAEREAGMLRLKQDITVRTLRLKERRPA